MQHAGYRGGHDPRAFYGTNLELKRALDRVGSGLFAPGDPGLFAPFVAHLLNNDPDLVLADCESYAARQDAVVTTWLDVDRRTRMSVLNVARMGRFSSDRAVREYAETIWRVEAVPNTGHVSST